MIELEKAIVQLVEERFVEVFIKQGADIEEEDIYTVNIAINKLTHNKPYLIYTHSGKYSSISAKARALSASKELTKNQIAQAFLVNDLAQRIVCNLYIKLNKPATQTRVFTDKEKAFSWLKQMLDNFRVPA